MDGWKEFRGKVERFSDQNSRDFALRWKDFQGVFLKEERFSGHKYPFSPCKRCLIEENSRKKGKKKPFF